MLAMPKQHYIRYRCDVEGVPVSQVAREVGVSWRTASKYATREDWNEKPQKRRVHYRKLGPFTEAIDQWLRDDERIPFKQRHTASRIYCRLTEELGFDGSRRAVQHYVRKRRLEMRLEHSQSYERLEHPGGEAQVDFGKSMVVRRDRYEGISVLQVTFPYSNASFMYPLPAENAECFMEGLKRLFGVIGGVPRRLWLDNLAAAVITKPGGERELTTAFSRFACHYRFTVALCNPGAGNEKGCVENSVGTKRRQLLSPPPRHDGDWEAMASQLNSRCVRARQELHYAKGRQIDQLWQEESELLLALPTAHYDVYKVEPRIVSNYGEVKIDDTNYRVPEVRPGRKVDVDVYWDRLVIHDELGRTVAEVARSYEPKVVVIDWKDALEQLKRKPRAVAYSSAVAALPLALRDYLRKWKSPEETCRALSAIARLLEEGFTPSDIDVGLQLTGADSEEFADGSKLRAALTYLTRPGHNPQPFDEVHTPDVVRTAAPDLTSYNQLVAGVKS